MFWTSIIFAIALSLDGFGVGISYGMRKIKIPRQSLIVICLSSASALALSMFAGNVISFFISKKLAEILGGLALLIVGGLLLLEAWTQRVLNSKKTKKLNDVPCTLFKFSIPGLGLVVQILKEPAKADLDSSGEISLKEAMFLGFALAMDALGAGLGAAMMGLNPLFTPLIAGISKFILVSLGLYLGSKACIDKILGDLGLLPGGIIMFLGVMKVLS